MIKNKLKKYKIILASGSPRRQQFFKDLHLDFEIRLKEIEEIFPNHLQESEITDYLVKLKANAYEGELLDSEILITSDTIVWLENKAVGKPKDIEDAIQILNSLSNKTHKVITSVCFKSKDNMTVINDETLVTFNNLSQEDVLFYIENYKPFDKAGAYGIQDWIGLIGVSKIEGSYANVMGMPTHRVYNYLNNLP